MALLLSSTVKKPKYAKQYLGFHKEHGRYYIDDLDQNNIPHHMKDEPVNKDLPEENQDSSTDSNASGRNDDGTFAPGSSIIPKQGGLAKRGRIKTILRLTLEDDYEKYDLAPYYRAGETLRRTISTEFKNTYGGYPTASIAGLIKEAVLSYMKAQYCSDCALKTKSKTDRSKLDFLYDKHSQGYLRKIEAAHRISKSMVKHSPKDGSGIPDLQPSYDDEIEGEDSDNGENG